MEHLYKIYPRTDISGILPNNKRILNPMVLTLNRKEFIKCMNAGTVYAIINGEEILIEEKDYQKAEALFDIKQQTEDNNESESISDDNIEIQNEHTDKYQKSQMNQSSSKQRSRHNRSRGKNKI